MDKITAKDTNKYTHAKECVAYEYGVDNNSCSICRSIINGRYPKHDYIVNKQVDEIL